MLVRSSDVFEKSKRHVKSLGGNGSFSWQINLSFSQAFLFKDQQAVVINNTMQN